MSSVQGLREFVSERLTSAAEEIFRVFEQTVVEYEKEIVRQRRLLDIVWKPEIKLHRTKLPQQHVCRKKKEVLTDQQLCDQETNSSLDQEDPQTPTAAAEEIPRVTQNIILEFNEDINYQRRLLDLVWKPEIKLHRTELPQQHICKEEEVLSDQDKNSSLDQEDPEPPQIKEEQERLCTSQEGEQPVLKQKSDAVMFTPTNEEINHSGQEPKSDQLLSHNSPVAESQDQRGSNDVDPGSTTVEESKSKKRKMTRHSDYVDNSFPTKRHRNTHTGNEMEYKTAKNSLRKTLNAKKRYKEKLDGTATGITNSTITLPEQLNQFYTRFETSSSNTQGQHTLAHPDHTTHTIPHSVTGCQISSLAGRSLSELET
ncbi:uncharacterized protein LOC117757714 [Hippoglossus hippoglossus]|uniref:uncharacterized protein LOC117757714 n=1 Tax=Hippoglossus hippoglossus TaxID=8267 RepID=UPI00148DAE43|nr:uncharacterized protein LOC117757714 [Hippoglossus hippoglossus]